MLCGEALSPGVCPALRLFSVFAAFLQTLKSFSRHLQHFCKPQIFFRGTCSVAAKSKKFFAALAAFLQTPKKFFAALAAFLQTPESFSKHLQRCCRGQKVFRSTCRVPANPKKFIAALAELPQASKWGKWPLRNFRKRPKGENGVCGTSAKADLFSETPVPPPLKTPALAMDIAGEWKNENGRIPEACAPQVPGRICWRTLLIPSVCRG